MAYESSNSGGSMFLSLLAVLFIGLKLTGHIDWSWVWVLAPLWIGLAVAVLAIVCFVGATLLERRANRKAA